MCPDKEVLSAYFDEEIESSLMASIKEHIEGCSSCRKELSRLEEIRNGLLAEDIPGIEESSVIVWQAINRVRKVATRERIWRKQLVIPVPVATAFMVLFVSVLSLFFVVSLKQDQPFRTVSKIETLPVDVQIKTIEDLHRAIEGDTAAFEVTILLPQEPIYNFSGKPKLLRAAEYERSK